MTPKAPQSSLDAAGAPGPRHRPAWQNDLLQLADKGSLRIPLGSDPGLIALMSSNKDVLVNLGLLERTTNCSLEVVKAWDCDRCTAANKPDAYFTIYGSSLGMNQADALLGMQFGRVWCVLIRGSHDFANWISDFNFSSVPWPEPWSEAVESISGSKGGCTSSETVSKCHGGYLQIWQSLEPLLIDALSARGILPGSTESVLLFSGHSLGSAVCTLGALAMWAKGYNILGNVNFESPLVMNCPAATRYQAALGLRTLRVTNTMDPVVHVPSHVYDYVHVGDELYMRAGTATLCSYHDVQRCRETRGSGVDCLCSSQDLTTFLQPAQHCRTAHYLTFDFCQCNDSSWNVTLVSLFQYSLWVVAIVALAFLAARLWLAVSDAFQGPVEGEQGSSLS